MLGLGLMSLHDLGDFGWRWLAVDVVWAIGGGLGIGYLLGMLIGRTILYLRTRHLEALGADEFIAFGLIALAYGVALLCHTYGFLAVFAAGLALRRVDQGPLPKSPALAAERSQAAAAARTHVAAARPADAPAYMMSAVQRFNEQLERFAEVAIVLVLGALVALIPFPSDVWWFIPLLFLVIRPAAVTLGLLGADVTTTQRTLISWFGIRGIGSIYYLMYAITHEVDPVLAGRLLSITVTVVVASIVVHGISVTPLMTRYERRKTPSKRRDGVT
jgi:NhaP-type Na+/H+ or K+/H+ antiporter